MKELHLPQFTKAVVSPSILSINGHRQSVCWGWVWVWLGRRRGGGGQGGGAPAVQGVRGCLVNSANTITT